MDDRSFLKRSSETMTGYLAPFDGSTSMALLTAAAMAKGAEDGPGLLLVLRGNDADDGVDAYQSLCGGDEMQDCTEDGGWGIWLIDVRMKARSGFARCRE